MNQRILSAKELFTHGAAITTDTGFTAVDVGLGYTNVGKREMKAIVGTFMTANTTSATYKLQDNTTSGATGFADISGASWTAFTTSDAGTEIHFSTNKRYVRAYVTVAGTTPSVEPFGWLFVAQREPT